MQKLQYISELSSREVQSIIKSVDTILCDVDGVLMLGSQTIPNADAAIAKLRNLGKQIGFVTDNAFFSLESIVKKLEPFHAEKEEILTPAISILEYFKINKFDKDLFVISSKGRKNALKDAGYNVIDYENIQSDPLEENFVALRDLSCKALEICHNVGAVVIDIDINCGHGAVQIVHVLLENIPDIQLITGTIADMIPMANGIFTIGNQYIIDGLQRWTDKKARILSKSGDFLPGIAKNKFNITESNKVLFIGDTIEVDMVFGANCGLKTCLVLSGNASQGHVDDWQHAEEYKPHFVATGLGEIYEKIRDM